MFDMVWMETISFQTNIIALFVMGDQLLLCDLGGMSKLGENQGEASELLRPARADPARQSCCGSLLGVLTSRNIAGAMGWVDRST